MTDAFVMLFVKHCVATSNIFRYAPAFPGHIGSRAWKLVGLETGSGGWGVRDKEGLDVVRFMFSVTIT